MIINKLYNKYKIMNNSNEIGLTQPDNNNEIGLSQPEIIY